VAAFKLLIAFIMMHLLLSTALAQYPEDADHPHCDANEIVPVFIDQIFASLSQNIIAVDT
jgi:hypothetical protein